MNTNPDDAREPAIRILDALHEATVVRDDANKRCISLQRVISSALHILDDMRHMEPDLGDRPQDTWRVFFIHAGEVASALKRAWPDELVNFAGSPLALVDRLINERDDLAGRLDEYARALSDYFDYAGAQHEVGCPEDDTCDCAHLRLLSALRPLHPQPSRATDPTPA